MRVNLLAKLCHDLRSNLNVINGYADVLGEETEAPASARGALAGSAQGQPPEPRAGRDLLGAGALRLRAPRGPARDGRRAPRGRGAAPARRDPLPLRAVRAARRGAAAGGRAHRPREAARDAHPPGRRGAQAQPGRRPSPCASPPPPRWSSSISPASPRTSRSTPTRPPNRSVPTRAEALFETPDQILAVTIAQRFGQLLGATVEARSLAAGHPLPRRPAVRAADAARRAGPRRRLVTAGTENSTWMIRRSGAELPRKAHAQ